MNKLSAPQRIFEEHFNKSGETQISDVAQIVQETLRVQEATGNGKSYLHRVAIGDDFIDVGDRLMSCNTADIPVKSIC